MKQFNRNKLKLQIINKSEKTAVV